jgi:flagellar biosynthesis protein FliQ
MPPLLWQKRSDNMTDPGTVVEIGRQALIISLVVSSPMLIGGLVIGLAIGVFQAVTQIHEMTLTFIPKILVMLGIMIVLMPWMTMKLMDYTLGLFEQISKLAY